MPTSSYSGIALASAPEMKKSTTYTLGASSSVDGDETNGFVVVKSAGSTTNKASFTAR